MHHFHLMMVLPLFLLLFVLLRRNRRGFSTNGGRFVRIGGVLLLIALLGFAGCTSPDALAVASGPLFPLNQGHWQPTPQDLAAPPAVAGR